MEFIPTNTARSWTERRETILQLVEKELLRDELELGLLAEIDSLVLHRDTSAIGLLAAILPGVAEAFEATLAVALYRLGGRFVVVATTSERLLNIGLSFGGPLREILESTLPTDRIKSIPTASIIDGDFLHGYGEGCLVIRVDQEVEPFALVAIFGRGLHHFSGHAFRLANSLTSQLSIAHRSTRWGSGLGLTMQVLDQVDSLFFSADAGGSQRSVESALTIISSHILRLFEEEMVKGPENESLRVQVLFPAGREHLRIAWSSVASDTGFRVRMSGSVCGEATVARRPRVIPDVRNVANYRRYLGEEMRSECAIPLYLGEELVAVLNIESSELDRFGGYPTARLLRYTSRLANVLAFARLSTDLSEGLERRHANETFVAMGMQAANLLHRVSGQLGLIRTRISRLSRTVEDEDVKAALAKVEGLIERAISEPTRMAESLQDLSVVDINEQVKLTVALERYRQYRGPTATVRLSVDYCGGSPRAEVFLFGDMLENLIDNALDACEIARASQSDYRGSVRVQTRIHHDSSAEGADPSENSYLIVSVEDNGPGLSPEAEGSLYRPGGGKSIAKRDSPEARSGLGLGLFLVKKSVLRVGGSIDVSPSAEGGTVAEIRLPLRAHTKLEEN